jgi:hypothetical protein
MTSATKEKPFNFMQKWKRRIVASEPITGPEKYGTDSPMGQKSHFSKRKKSMVKRRTSISVAEYKCLEDKTNKLPW